MDTSTHTHHASHPHAADGGSWSQAARATLHCLTGFAIVLAFAFGYTLTITPVLRSGVALKAAIAVTLAADTVSIAVMELVDNSVVLVIPGAMDAGLGTVLF